MSSLILLIHAAYILVIIALRNGLAPDQRQTISQTNADFLYIRNQGPFVSKIFYECCTFSMDKIKFKMLDSIK